jgi:hypothetical protein
VRYFCCHGFFLPVRFWISLALPGTKEHQNHGETSRAIGEGGLLHRQTSDAFAVLLFVFRGSEICVNASAFEQKGQSQLDTRRTVMTFEEFQEARNTDLRDETKKYFDRFNEPNTGDGGKPALLLEAQFYMQELGRREDPNIARRDFRMELIVIFLIALELVAAVSFSSMARPQVSGSKSS